MQVNKKQTQDLLPTATEDADLPSAQDFENMKNVPKNIQQLIFGLLENLKMQERLYLYRGDVKAGYLEITSELGPTPPLGNEEKIRIVALDQDGIEGIALEMTHSVQVSGDFYTLSYPGFEIAIGSTNGTITLSLENEGVTRSIRINYTGNGEPQIYLDNLPTSASGLTTGALWNSSGTVKVV